MTNLHRIIGDPCEGQQKGCLGWPTVRLVEVDNAGPCEVDADSDILLRPAPDHDLHVPMEGEAKVDVVGQGRIGSMHSCSLKLGTLISCCEVEIDK